MMEDCWMTFQPSIARQDIVGKWVACIYVSKKAKPVEHLFIGRVKERFLLDEPGAEINYTTGLEVDCLQEKLGFVDNVLSEHPPGIEDKDTFCMSNIICSGFQGVFQGGKKWCFPDYQKIREFFETVKNKASERSKLHDKFTYKILGDK